MSDYLYIDTETYSPEPIKSGVYRYAEGAEVMLITYALNNGPVQILDLTELAELDDLTEVPGAMRAFLSLDSNPLRKLLAEHPPADGLVIVAHNAAFDYAVMRKTAFDIEQYTWHDTMVQAYAHSLPGSLGSLCEVFGLAVDKAKDKAGRRLINLFCKPDKTGNRKTRLTHPDDWEEFKRYAIQDIVSMRELHRKMPHWNYPGNSAELNLRELDQIINRRGVCIDAHLVDEAIDAIEDAQRTLSERTQHVTDGHVSAATQRDAMLKHILNAHGVSLPDMQKATLERRLNDENLPPVVKELIEIRLQASTSSTAKYKTLSSALSSDNRLRGALQFCGASRTGRWSGRLFQPQNLPRPKLPVAEIDAGITGLKLGCVELITDNVMELTSSALRGVIVAPAGKKLVVSDLSNIEGRVQAWLAGETWKLKAFADFDAGQGHDLYKLAYAKSFGVKPEDVTKDQRQVGKVQELALGYQGGVGAFITFASAYNLDLEQMAKDALPTLPENIRTDSYGMLEWTRNKKRPTFGLSDDAFVVCEAFKRLWRDAHSHIATFWQDIDNTVRAALQVKGLPPRKFPCGPLSVDTWGVWLRIRLPSGRYLCYPGAKIDEENKITYLGINQYSRKWQRISTYGGKLFENICQAVARDVMAFNMPHIEAAGYEIVLTVHDEVITEAPDTPDYSCEHLSQLLANVPTWATGLPLAAGGFESYRYKKE